MQKQLTTNKIKTASYVAVGGCGQVYPIYIIISQNITFVKHMACIGIGLYENMELKELLFDILRL